VHYNRLSKGVGLTKFKCWNYKNTIKLADLKKGRVTNKGDFLKTVEDNFLLYYQPLIPWVNRLRKVIFLNGRRRKGMDKNFFF